MDGCDLAREQGWHRGERTCLPPMWLGFDSRSIDPSIIFGSLHKNQHSQIPILSGMHNRHMLNELLWHFYDVSWITKQLFIIIIIIIIIIIMYKLQKYLINYCMRSKCLYLVFFHCFWNSFSFNCTLKAWTWIPIIIHKKALTLKIIILELH